MLKNVIQPLKVAMYISAVLQGCLFAQLHFISLNKREWMRFLPITVHMRQVSVIWRELLNVMKEKNIAIKQNKKVIK